MSKLQRLGFFLKTRQQQHGICSTELKSRPGSFNLSPCRVLCISSWNEVIANGRRGFSEKLLERNITSKSKCSPPWPSHLPLPWDIHTPYPSVEWDPKCLKLFHCIFSLYTEVVLTLFTSAVCKETTGACSLLSAFISLHHLIQWESYSLLQTPHIHDHYLLHSVQNVNTWRLEVLIWI